MREVAKGLRGINQKLEEQFDDAAAAAERSGLDRRVEFGVGEMRAA